MWEVGEDSFRQKFRRGFYKAVTFRLRPESSCCGATGLVVSLQFWDADLIPRQVG